MMLAKILVQLSWIVGVLCSSSSLISPCKRNDEVCMTRSANMVAAMIMPGIPSLGVDAIDPVLMKQLSFVISKITLNLTDNVVAGYTKCKISDVKLNLDEWKLKFNVTCPKLLLTGHMVLTGEVLGVPVEGDDDYEIISGQFLVSVDADVKKVATSDGVNHMTITPLAISGVAIEPFQFKYDNLIPKRKLTPEETIEFENNKFLKMVELASPLFLRRQYGVMFESVNKFLESVPFDDLFLD